MFKSQKTTVTDANKVQYCVDMIGQIDGDYADIKQNNIEAFDYYFGKGYMKDLKGRSTVYTSDLADTIEWIMPSLVRIFAGGDDVTSLTPRKKENTQQVQNHNELVNYQIKVKNKWFIIINDWFKDALLLKRGAVKRQWHKEIEKDDKDFENVDEMTLMQLASDPNVTKVEVTNETVVSPERLVGDYNEYGQIVPRMIPSIKAYDCTIYYEFEDEYPLIEAVPSEEYGFPVDTRDIEDCRFFYHRIKYTKWQFIDKYGEDSFKKVEELKETYQNTTDDGSVTDARFSDINGLNMQFFYDQKDGMWLVYENYFINQDTGEPWIRIICGNQLLKDEKNVYKMPPFRILTPIKLSHRIIGMSLFDILKDLQKIRTSLLRQMLDNVYFNNNGRTIIDPTKVSFEDFLNANRPGGVVRTLNGYPANAEGIFPLPTPSLQPWTFEVFETMNKEKDYHTGVPRSFQGVNPNVLNKTYRGQNQQVAQAQQRIEMMARLFAEMGIAPLIRDIVDMNTRFMKDEIAIKVVNDWIEVTPEDVVAKADVIINVGLGTTSKDTLVSQNQQMIALYMQMYPIFGEALNDKMLHALKELVKAMGYRDTQNWVPGEEEMQEAIQKMEKQRYLEMMNKGGSNSKGTQPDQLPNQQATQAAQPMNPNTMIPDIMGEYFG